MVEYLSTAETIGAFFAALTPVWIALAIMIGVSFVFRRKLGLYGRLYDTGLGIAGVFFVFFWIFAAVFSNGVTVGGQEVVPAVAKVDPLTQSREMKNEGPGAIHPETGAVYIFGGDKFGRDVFSRLIEGSKVVLIIAPAATLLAFIVGMFLGLPAGYFGGRLDSILSFFANLILAFPVILLFYLLVTPGIRDEAYPILGLWFLPFGLAIPVQAAVIFAVIATTFFAVLAFSKYRGRMNVLAPALVAIIGIGSWLTLSVAFDRETLAAAGVPPLVSIAPEQLNIFVAVVFASSPGVFRIVRGLSLDIATRDYVAAAQTRGEGPWYIMLWEILPNSRGPLIVDACLRIGYTTILLGTLGYFGLGLEPESPDWGTTIKEGSRLLRIYVHPVLPPALALMSFVLGLNLLADALREQSLKD